MTVRDLRRSEFLASLPDQLQSAFVVFLVNADPDAARVAADAWAVARALAAERRTCLVDLCVTRPVLAPERTAPEGEGIVDAFLYGVSLPRVAVEQTTPGLFVISAGTHTAQPEPIWRNVRWGRLARGFAAERAALMLLGPVEAVAAFPTTPDTVILLSAADVEPPGRMIALAEAGVPVVRVIPDAPPRHARRDPVPEPSAPAAAPKPRRARRRWWMAAAGLVVLGSAGAVALEVLGASPGRGIPPSPATPAGSPPAPADPPPRSAEGDSLFYAVQVAAFTSAENAVERATDYWEAGWTATVSPVRLGRQGTWHRLLVGALPGPLEAEATLERLWADGLLEPRNGAILRTPLALEVATSPDSASAETALAGVRGAGSAGYIVRALDGTYRILVGAFETPEQAARADSILDTTDLQGTIVRRAGIAR